MASTSGVCRRAIHNCGDDSTGVASIYAQERQRDKPVFHGAFSAGRCLLVGLWSFIELATSNPVEFNIISSYVRNAVCQGEVWEIVRAAKLSERHPVGSSLLKPGRHVAELLNTTSQRPNN